MYTNEDVVRLYLETNDTDTPIKFHFFWGGPFSQWAESPFTIGGEEFITAEHYMMIQKAKLFDDDHTLKLMRETSSPSEVKALGRKVKNFDVDVWNEVCMDIVTRGNYAKFSQNGEFFKYMLKTSDSFLVEASSYDKIWGIGMGECEDGIDDPRNWRGTNLLGQCIMMARDRLLDEFLGRHSLTGRALSW